MSNSPLSECSDTYRVNFALNAIYCILHQASTELALLLNETAFISHMQSVFEYLHLLLDTNRSSNSKQKSPSHNNNKKDSLIASPRQQLLRHRVAPLSSGPLLIDRFALPMQRVKRAKWSAKLRNVCDLRVILLPLALFGDWAFTLYAVPTGLRMYRKTVFRETL